MRGKLIVYCSVVFFVANMQVSCITSEPVYISNVQRDSSCELLDTYSTIIHSGDLLYIYVASMSPEGALPFNQEVHRAIIEKSGKQQSYEINSQEPSKSNLIEELSQIDGYYVSDDGYITFPILGRLNVLGLTRDSLGQMIAQLLVDGNYLYDPVVSVELMNFRISVIGEVVKPQELHIVGNRLTIFEALAMCGDVTNDGMRDHVTVIREKNGEVISRMVDLTTKMVFDSDVYYLQSNDIVYVEPCNRKKRLATRNESAASAITTIISLLIFLRSLWLTSTVGESII